MNHLRKFQSDVFGGVKKEKEKVSGDDYLLISVSR